MVVVDLHRHHVKRTVEGIPLAGYADSLDSAQQQFQEAFGKGLYAAGVVALPDQPHHDRKTDKA